ncbi:MAG: O-antigen ligase family protein, partial [Gemmatimonadaceae bacterium]
TEVSDQMRRRLLTAGLEMVRDNPVLGVGPGAFRWTLPAYDDMRDISDLRYLPAHNVAMELWAQSGTPAVLLYAAFLVLVLLAAERRRRATAGADQAVAVAATAGILALCATYAFHNYAEDNLLWALAALAVSWAVWPDRAAAAR